MPAAIEINHLYKQYSLRGAPYKTLRELLSKPLRRNLKNVSAQFWALEDIHLKINEGDRVGIVGANGAGKSTLLKIISQITPPTRGEIVLHGRVASLLEVGTAFHPELTGKENIFLNGSILGMRRTEILQRMDEIVTFSGVEKFIDQPLKNYSSGMQMRLAFSVAAHLHTDILLVDEVLAVGDLAFQKKCLSKMDEVNKQEGKTLLFVSHNLQQLKTICNNGILLQQGKLHLQGTIKEAIDAYTANLQTAATFYQNSDPNKEFNILEVSMRDAEGALLETNTSASQPCFIKIIVNAAKKIEHSLVAIRFTNTDGVAVFTTTNGDLTNTFPVVEAGTHTFNIQLPLQLLVPGTYTIIVAWIIPHFKELDVVTNKMNFTHENENYAGDILKDERQSVLNYPITWAEL